MVAGHHQHGAAQAVHPGSGLAELPYPGPLGQVPADHHQIRVRPAQGRGQSLGQSGGLVAKVQVRAVCQTRGPLQAVRKIAFMMPQSRAGISDGGKGMHICLDDFF